MKGFVYKLVLLTICSLFIGGSMLLADRNVSLNILKVNTNNLSHRNTSLSIWPNTEVPNLYSNLFPSIGNYTFHITDNVKPRFVFVGLGDSFGAGQGAPNNVDRNSALHLGIPWLEDLVPPDHRPVWKDRPCRRSTNSAFEKAYNKLLETPYGVSNLRSLLSMHFQSYACSGAVTENFSIESEKVGPKFDEYNKNISIAPQLDQLHDDWHNDSVDALVMSIGGNDVGYGEAIEAMVLGDINCINSEIFDTCPDTVTNDWIIQQCDTIVVTASAAAGAAFGTGFGDLGTLVGGAVGVTIGVGVAVNPVLHPFTVVGCKVVSETVYQLAKEEYRKKRNNWKTNLFASYSRINTRLMSPEFNFIKQNDYNRKNIFLMEYPDPFHDENGNYCNPEDITRDNTHNPWNGDKFFQSVSLAEIEYLGESLYRPLITAMRTAADDNNWTIIDIADGSKIHGLCTRNRYINQNIDALKRQGADIAPPVSLSGGLIHPNNAGYNFMAGQLVKKLEVLAKDKLVMNSTDMPTNITAEVDNGILKIHWDDNSNKESGYIVKISNKWQPKEFKYDVPTNSNKYHLNINDLLAWYHEGIININIIIKDLGGIPYNQRNKGIHIALKKPEHIAVIDSTKKVKIGNGTNTPSGIFLKYKFIPKNSSALTQIVAWANVDDNVTLHDIEKMQITWIKYQPNQRIKNTKKIDNKVSVYYDFNDNLGGYNIKYSSKKVFAVIQLCNNLSCSGWSLPAEAHPVIGVRGTNIRADDISVIPSHNTNINSVNISNSIRRNIYNEHR